MEQDLLGRLDRQNKIAGRSKDAVDVDMMT